MHKYFICKITVVKIKTMSKDATSLLSFFFKLKLKKSIYFYLFEKLNRSFYNTCISILFL